MLPGVVSASDVEFHVEFLAERYPGRGSFHLNSDRCDKTDNKAGKVCGRPV